MSETVRIREARLEDQGALGPFLHEVLGAELDRQHARAAEAGQASAAAEEELMAADDFWFSNIDLMNCTYLARTREGELVGAAIVNPYTAELPFVAVHPDHRRQGIGRRLVASALDELARRGVDHIAADAPVAEAFPEAVPFFEALGFVEIRRVARMGLRLEMENDSEGEKR